MDIVICTNFFMLYTVTKVTSQKILYKSKKTVKSIRILECNCTQNVYKRNVTDMLQPFVTLYNFLCFKSVRAQKLKQTKIKAIMNLQSLPKSPA